MISGTVGNDGVPVIPIPIDGQIWRAVVDTGFNGDLQLPNALRSFVRPRFVGRARFALAAGQFAVEDNYLVDFPFDGQIVLAEATFTEASEILLGTGLLRKYRLDIHFPNRTVTTCLPEQA